MLSIKPVHNSKDYPVCVRILNKSFGTVAHQFNLTRENCPTNAAFITVNDLIKKRNRNINYYLAYSGQAVIGFVATEKSSGNRDEYYIEKLAVLPAYRHRGFGKDLMEFAENKIKEAGGGNISIGIISDNRKLKDWYLSLGYVVNGFKQFRHLPFTVCFLSKELN